MTTRRAIRVVLWILLAVLVAIAVLVAVVLIVPAPAERWLQQRMMLALREHYQANVQLQNLQVSLIPTLQATGDNLVIPRRGDPDLPPLITVKHFVLQASVFSLLRTPVHITHLELDGLEIRAGGGRREPHKPSPLAPKSKPTTRLANFVIDRVQADHATLYILRKDPSREPLLFDLRKLSLRSAGVGQPMNFSAQLTNPTPPGLIDTTGHFGPWDFDEPSNTPVGGQYNFQHADLSVFNGISGILSSVGDYSGVLQKINVDGITDTPDFKLDSGGEAVHLTTRFHAIVDGTNGNTYLQPVKAHFLNSDILTNGEVASKPGEKGKTITLAIDMEHAKVQDMLSLASKTEPPILTGALVLKANLDLPPGKEPVLQKMILDGKFRVSEARFSNSKISQVIAELSRRGQGKAEDQSITDVPAVFNGSFDLRNSTLTFADLQFVVPGAAAQMKGSYALRGGAINFTGDVRLNATISQMVGGSKGWILAPFDPIFSKHGAGTDLPITITGTREHPELHVEWKKIFQ